MSDGNQLFAVNLATSVTVWQLAIFGQPTYAKGMLYLNDGARVTAVSALTGLIVWQHSFSAGASVSPASVRDGTVYVTADGNVFALDALSGSQIWQASTPWRGAQGPVAVTDSAIFVSSVTDPSLLPWAPGGTIVALDPHTGQFRWEHETTAGPTPPVAGATAVYFTDGPRVTALTASDGAQLWQTTAPVFTLDNQLALSNGLVVGGSVSDGSLFAWRTSDGSAQWSLSPGYGQILSATSVAGGVIYENFSTTGVLAAFDQASGQQLWMTRLDTNTADQSAPAIVKGRLFDLVCSYECPAGSTLFIFGL